MSNTYDDDKEEGEQDKKSIDDNEVDLSKTLWQVLRKVRSQNAVLKNFHSDSQTYNLRAKDIVKFGRVNFKVIALQSKKLDKEIQSE